MSNWTDYKDHARSKGVLAAEFYVVSSVPQVAPEELLSVLPDHLAYQKKLEKEGVLVFAGPLSDEAGENWSGEGLVIYRAGSLDEARDIAARDPIHTSGLRKATVRRWLMNEGSLTVTLSLSDQRLGLD